MATTAIAASSRMAILFEVRTEGRRPANQAGIGFDPLTLSKTILSGQGLSRPVTPSPTTASKAIVSERAWGLNSLTKFPRSFEEILAVAIGYLHRRPFAPPNHSGHRIFHGFFHGIRK